ncbi:major facilitator superfamily domain-containing protein [Mycena floridula]|nr:major facilitator superfamily domain-containing protein [Mycena floridula]
MFFLVASLSFLVVALNLGGQSIPWSSPSIIGILCAAVVSLVAFVIAEFYAELPVAPVNLFSQWKWRNVPIMLGPHSISTKSTFLLSFFHAVFLQVTGISNIAAAALVIPFLLCAGIASTIANEIVTRYGHTRPVFLGALATLPVALGLMATLDETSSLGRIVGYSILAGCSFGPGTQLTMVIAQVGLPSHVLATVTALVGSSPTLGGVLGVGIVGSIINNAFRHSLSHSTVADFSNLNLNDVVQSVLATPAGLVRDTMIKAYISAWRAGFLALAGITAAQFLLCLMLRPIELDDGATQEKPVDGTQQERPTDEPKAAEDAARTV